MKEFENKSICILGRQEQLGLAELESLYGPDHIQPISGAAILDIKAEDINFKRLGGTIKVARILAEIPTTKWRDLAKYLADKIPEHIKYLPDGKFTLGVSAYCIKVQPNEINTSLLKIKKVIQKSGRPVRIVPNKTQELNSAQVLHNKLTHRGAWELIFIADGTKTYLAQTLFVQDIQGYAARDQARPARDSRVGMLPPKLAQIIINLATPLSDPRKKMRILDPFCGSGVILQEAMLMGYSVIGSDIDPRMAEYSKKNIQWLVKKYPQIESSAVIEIGDATSYQWAGFSAIASEAYLGRPLGKLPQNDAMKQIVSDTNTIIKKFLNNLNPQLKKGQIICIAIPAWQRPDGTFMHLPVLDKLTDMGYNYLDLKHVRRNDLLYFRADQIVARQLVRLEKA